MSTNFLPLSKPSLYGRYLKELVNRQIVETEQGFITYEIVGEVCYLFDIFTDIEARHTNLFYELCFEARERAREAGCKRLVGFVSISSADPSRSMKMLLGMGMKIMKADADRIYMERAL